MVATLFKGTPAREAGYEMIQYIAARHTLTGTDLPVTKVGTIPAGAVLLAIISRVAVAVTGGTPVLGMGSVAAGGAVPAVGGTGNVVIVMAEAAGSEIVFPLAALVNPPTTDLDIYIGTSGGATAGDVYVAILFMKPVA
jgi:hypothetical protein